MDEKRERNDKRLMERDVSRGLLKESTVTAHLAALPDESNNAQWVEIELHDTELSGEGSGNSGNHSGTP